MVLSGGQSRPYREFGAWLRSRRLARRLTQADLSRLLAYEVSYVRKVEWGIRRPSEAFLARVVHVFDLPQDAVPTPDFGDIGPQLPNPTTSFIGREDEVQSVIDLVRSARLVTLVGAPGIGKTRLGIEVARVFDGRLEHGSRFVALDTVADAHDVPAATARALGLAAAARASEQAVIDHLRPRRLLLVCDNMEHVLEARSFLGSVLAAAPGVRVLATSREPLHVSGEACYPVPPLAFPDPDALPPSAAATDWPAVALFLSRARLVQPDFTLTADNTRAVVAACAALDGVPLAIELTASTMRLFTPEALLERIDGAMDLPVSPPRDVALRQRSITAALDWSLELLSDEERAIFPRLGVFVGGFSFEAAAGVCCDRPGPVEAGAVEAGAVEAVVASLVEKSLVGTRIEPGTDPRLYLLEVVRQYAMSQLVARGEDDDLRRRHAEHYAGWTESVEHDLTGPDQARRLADLDEEGANVGAALGWAVGHDPLLALRLCGATWRWWMRGPVAEARRWFDAALAGAAPSASDHASGVDADAIRVKVLDGAGALAAAQGDYDAALALLRPALAMAAALGLDDARALAHLHIGIVAEARGDYVEAARRFEESAEVYQACRDPRGHAHAVNALAAVATDTGDYERARALFEQSLGSFRRLGDRWSEALVTANLGWTALALCRPAQARAWYDESLTAWRGVGDERGVATVLTGLARAGRQLAAPPREVAGRLEEGLLLFAKVGDRRGIAECLEELAAAAGDGGQWHRAGVLLAAAAAQRRAMSANPSPVERQRVEGMLDEVARHLDADQFEDAAGRGDAIGLDQAVTIALRWSPG
jgi:predicted ATPase